MADEPHQRRQNGPAVQGIPPVTGAQVTHQKVPSAKDIQQEIAVVIVVSVEELTRLVDLHWDIGAVEVQHDFPGRLVVLLNVASR